MKPGKMCLQHKGMGGGGGVIPHCFISTLHHSIAIRWHSAKHWASGQALLAAFLSYAARLTASVAQLLGNAGMPALLLALDSTRILPVVLLC